MQVSVPEDYRLWYETMLTEFPTRFQRLFAGPMWSGAAKDDIRNPLKVSLDEICNIDDKHITVEVLHVCDASNVEIMMS